MTEQTPDPSQQSEVTPAEAKRNLAQAVQREVAGGYRVESQTDVNAILVKGGKINHTLHLILTIITCSFWGLVWIAVYFINKEKRLILNVDDYGNILRQET